MSVTIPVTTGPQQRLDVADVSVDLWATAVDLVFSKPESGARIGYAPMSVAEVDDLIAQLVAAKTQLTMWEDSALNDPVDDGMADALAAAWAQGAMTP